MKKSLFAVAAIALTLLMPPAVATASDRHAVPFELYSSYFVRNDAVLPTGRVNLVLSSQDEFDRVFGAAAVMGHNSFLPADVFAHHLVAVTILRGNLRSYKIREVYAADQKLHVVYTAHEEPASSATYASPLIVAVEKGNYTSVEFVENRTKVNTISVPIPR